MQGKFYTTTVAPNIDTAGATAYAAADILFDWFPFEIPSGSAITKYIHATMVGTEGAQANVLDIDLLFARSINGVAPTTLGTVNGATTAARMAGCRRNILFRNFSSYADVNHCLKHRRLLARFQFKHSLLKQLAIHFVTNRCDMTRLLCPKQISRTTNF